VADNSKLKINIKLRHTLLLGWVIRGWDTHLLQRLWNTSSNYTVETEWLQNKAGMVKKLDGHHQTRSEGHGHTWDEAEELATDRAEWRQRVAQCFHQNVR